MKLNSHLSRALVVVLSVSPVLATPQGDCDTERVSLTSTGAEPTFRSNYPVISADGRIVAFESSADDLVPGDTNFSRDIFVRDRDAGTTTRVSVSSSEAQGNSHSYNPSMSTDGRYIVFHSKASNFVSGDVFGGFLDAFVHDRDTGTTTLLSVSMFGGVASGNSYDVDITPDGSYVAFYSSANDLVANDTNNRSDAFIRDLGTGAITRVSVSSAGVEGDGNSLDVTFSSDGQIVTFSSLATNLVAGDTNGAQDVFVHVVATGVTTRVSESTFGVQGNSFSRLPRMSSDGRFVAFESRANTLVPNDTNSSDDVFLHDRTTGVTSIVSVDSNGVYGNNASRAPSMSADGQRIAFYSWASNLVPGDVGNLDIFVHDTTLQVTQRTSVDSFGVPGNGHSVDPCISADGRFVAFQSASDNLVTGDTNGYEDIFVNDTVSTATATLRNAGTNPASYTVSAPILGAMWTASVDLTTTGHGSALVIGTVAPATLTLGGGQVLLIGGPEVFELSLAPGPIATWTVMIPNDSALLGLVAYTQAGHFFGVSPFALSNAQDLCLGY